MSAHDASSSTSTRLPRGVADVVARAVERGHGRDGFSRVIDELRTVPTPAR